MRLAFELCSSFGSDIYPYWAQVTGFQLEHHFPVILQKKAVILIFMARVWEKAVDALKLTVQKAPLPWDPFQAKMCKCHGEKQKGKFIKEN